MRLLLILLITIPLMINPATTAIYMASDNSMVTAYHENMQDLIQGSDNAPDMDILIRADLPEASYVMHLKNGVLDTLSIESGSNSGDSRQVGDFFKSTFRTYSSDRNIMILWDHGNGWYDFKNSKSILYDNDPDDFISITDGELNEIFKAAYEGAGKKIDIAVFDACDMQCIEVLYEIKAYADYSLATQIRCPYYGLPYDKAIPVLNRQGDDFSICTEVCDSFFAEYEESVDSLQLSVVKLSEIDRIAEAVSKENILAFPDVNGLDVSIPSSILGDAVYSVQDTDYLTGLKIFATDYDIFTALYADYIQLGIDSAYDIARKEFNLYGIPDTIAPLRTKTMEYRELQYSNVNIDFPEPYDFSHISSYFINVYSGIEQNAEMFTDTNIDFITGDFSFSGNLVISEPYSIRCSDICIETGTAQILNLHIWANDTVIAQYDNDQTVILPDDRWQSVIIETDDDICISSSEVFYIDDMTTMQYTDKMEIVANENNVTLHKLHSGINKISISAVDALGNRNTPDTLFTVNVNSMLTPYVYPNPTDRYLNIATEIEQECRIVLTDMQGRKIAEYNAVPDNYLIDLMQVNLAPGMYFVIIISENNTYRCKFAYYD